MTTHPCCVGCKATTKPLLIVPRPGFVRARAITPDRHPGYALLCGDCRDRQNHGLAARAMAWGWSRPVGTA